MIFVKSVLSHIKVRFIIIIRYIILCCACGLFGHGLTTRTVIYSLFNIDETRIATRLRNRSDGTAAGGHVRLSNDSVGFRQLSDTRRTESEEENVRQKRADWCV